MEEKGRGRKSAFVDEALLIGWAAVSAANERCPESSSLSMDLEHAGVFLYCDV